jgi:hypothetical protein
MYYLIISLPFVFFFSRLFLTNYAVPTLKKRQLRKLIATRVNAKAIFEAESFLKILFKNNYSKTLSRIYRLLHHNNNREFIYGEIDLLAFLHIIEKAEPKNGDIFYDLGSGSGKAVFAAALYFDFKMCSGIELMNVLYDKSLTRLSEAKDLSKNRVLPQETYSQKLSKIRFLKNDFLAHDFSDANIIYVAATCLSDDTFRDLMNKICRTEIGTRVIVATRKISHDAFELVDDSVELMGWGLCHVRIYRHI